MFESNILFPLFVGVCFILGGANFVFFYLGKNGRLKRIVWPVSIILGLAILVAFVWLMKLPSHMTKMVIPMFIVIAMMNLLMVKFCLSCGAMVMSQTPFKRPAKCPKCNADWNDDKSGDVSVLRPED
ncbi:MAG: hypothetical protein ACYTEU_08195 [Planctomycetota bacterium]|jgi:hypothetical protein